MIFFQELNGDQRRESVNSRQRFEAWRKAKSDVDRFKGSMVWNEDKGTEYLVRSYYDRGTGIRRQTSLGPRSPSTDQKKAEFERGREQAKERFAELQNLLERQASLNRAVGIGRVPLIGARIIRALDSAGLLGRGIRIVGTNAIYAYEASAGVFVEAGLTTTEDIDLLFDARRAIRFSASKEVSERSLLGILRKVDRSFERDSRAFRAVNRDGYLVDFIKPQPSPPWAEEREQIGDADDDLTAAGIEGLQWLEDSPLFESVAIDEKGMPLRVEAPDPRVFAIHKLWLSRRADRSPLKRRRDEDQARAVAQLVSQYLTHLPYDRNDLTVLPRQLFEDASPLFSPASSGSI